MHKVGGHVGEPLVVAFRPTIFNRNVLAVDVASLLQPLQEAANIGRKSLRRRAIEKTDDWRRRLFAVRRDRQCRRASEECDELTPPHMLP